jgi:hypothetical protein
MRPAKFLQQNKIHFSSAFRKVNMKKKLFFSLLCHLRVLALVIFASISLHGQIVNPGVNIQGILRDVTGKTVDDGQYSVTFKLYPVKTGGTSVWQETADVNVTGGIYSHNLGSVNQLDADNFNTTLYLGVKLNGFELTPRTELTYAPYTFAVARALKVACSGALGDIKYSILNPTEFAAVNGDCWVPMDGGALGTSSRLRQVLGITSVPDGSGLAIRAQEFTGGQDNDPDRTPNSPIATLQSSEIKSHTHSLGFAGTHTHDFLRYLVTYGTVSQSEAVLENYGSSGNDQGQFIFYDRVLPGGQHTHYIHPAGGSENVRQKNLNFWVYIRVN